MKIYKCIVSGDELFTDAKKVTEEDGFYKVVGKHTSRSNTFDDALIGANASAEEPQEDGAEDTTESGIDIVLNSRYTQTHFGSKKEYQIYMKDYIKKLKEIINPGDVAAFDAGILAAFKKAAGWFKDLDFYSTESMDPHGIIPICKWEVPEGETNDVPVFHYYKVGVKEEKV